VRGSNKVMDQDPEGKYEALSKYARDLTAAARDGKLDPVIGRDDQVGGWGAAAGGGGGLFRSLAAASLAVAGASECPAGARPALTLAPRPSPGGQIRRAIQILSRRTKNNPVLIGEVRRPGLPGPGQACVPTL
jgi:hypothetical protein